MFFPPGLYLTQRCLDPKSYMNGVPGPSPWREGGGSAETNHIVSLLSTPTCSFLMKSDFS